MQALGIERPCNAAHLISVIEILVLIYADAVIAFVYDVIEINYFFIIRTGSLVLVLQS